MGNALRMGLMGGLMGGLQELQQIGAEQRQAEAQAQTERLRRARMLEEHSLRLGEAAVSREEAKKIADENYARSRADKLADEERQNARQDERDKASQAHALRLVDAQADAWSRRDSAKPSDPPTMVTYRMEDGFLKNLPATDQAPAGARRVEYATGGRMGTGLHGETGPSATKSTGYGSPSANPTSTLPAPSAAVPYKDGTRLQGPDGVYVVQNGQPVKVN